MHVCEAFFSLVFTSDLIFPLQAINSLNCSKVTEYELGQGLTRQETRYTDSSSYVLPLTTLMLVILKPH